jgi:hypothetical protein
MVLHGEELEAMEPSKTYAELQTDSPAAKSIGQPSVDKVARPSSATSGPTHYYSYQLMGLSRRKVGNEEFDDQDLQLLANTVESHVSGLIKCSHR